MKKLNYKIGALKRQFKLGKGEVAPGTFINLANAQKTAKNKGKSASSNFKAGVRALI